VTILTRVREGPTVVVPDAPVAVDPGQEAECTVTVRSRAAIVDQLTLDVLGPAAAWSTVEPRSVSLFPGAEARVRVSFRIPRTVEATPGPLPFGIRAASVVDPERVTVEEGNLQIGAFTEVSAEMTPRTSRGRLSGRHEIRLRSDGNSPVRVSLKARDPEDALRLDLRPSALTLQPGRAARARLRVRPRRTIWSGTPEAHSFELRAEPESGNAIKLDGGMRQRPMVSRLTILAAMALIALGGLAFAQRTGRLPNLGPAAAVSSGTAQQSTGGSARGAAAAGTAASPSAPAAASHPTAQTGGQSGGQSGGSGAPSVASSAFGFLEAVVRADGSLVRSSGRVTVSHPHPGYYDVTFPRDVSTCAYTATIGDPANGQVSSPALALVATGGKGGAPDVVVETMAPNGTVGAWPFHLSVDCDPMGPWAVVRSDGTVARSASSASVSHLGVGRYEVAFNQNVSDCAYVASVGDPSDVLPTSPALVFTAGGHSGANDVYVETKNPGGGLTDWPFHLAVNCGPQLPWVVTNYTGGPVRGGDGAAVTRLGPGQFEVHFSQNVSACTYVATVGDPGNQLVYNPGLVSTAGGHSGATDVYVQTTNPAGAAGDWPFQLYVSC
jgi:hypothetical protein